MATSTERKEATPISASELMGLSKWELVQIVHWAISSLEPAEQRSVINAILAKAKRRLADRGYPGPHHEPKPK